MARLPIPGSDDGSWGDILNDFLAQAHNPDGTLKPGALAASDVGLGNVNNTSDANKPVSTATQTALNAKAPTTRQVIAGTGLTGGGDLSADRTLAVSYGATAGTAAQGNDTRIVGAVQGANNGTDFANAGSTRSNLHVPILVSCQVVATANLTLSGLQTIDGYTTVSGDQVLAVGQTTASQNGPWVAGSGAWTRPTDYPSGGAVKGRIIQVNGATYIGTVWAMVTSTSVTVDTTATTWQQINRTQNDTRYIRANQNRLTQIMAAEPTLTPAPTFTDIGTNTSVISSPVFTAANVTTAPFTYNITDPLIPYSTSYASSLGPTPTGGGARTHSTQGISIEFDFDGQYLELQFNETATLAFRVWVNEQESATFGPPSGIGKKLIGIDFGSRQYRRIVIEVDSDCAFGGTNTYATDTISKSSYTSNLKFAVVGDSYCYGQGYKTSGGGGVLNSARSYFTTLSRALGFAQYRKFAVSGTGLLGGSNVYSNRMADVVSYAPDVVIVQGSINDNGFETPLDGSGHSPLYNAAVSYITALKAALPNATIIMTSPLRAKQSTTQDQQDTVILASVATLFGIPYIDVTTENWFTGTGNTVSPVGDGNADYYQQGLTGGTGHPSPAGHIYLGQRMARAVGQILLLPTGPRDLGPMQAVGPTGATGTTGATGPAGTTRIGTITTDAGPSNTTTETDLINITCPTNAVANDTFHLKLGGEVLNNSGSNATITFKVYVGSTAVVTSTAAAFPTSASPYKFSLITDVVMKTTATQRALSELRFAIASATTLPLSSTSAFSGVGYGTASEDMTTAKAIRVTCTLGTAASTISCTAHLGWLDLIRS